MISDYNMYLNRFNNEWKKFIQFIVKKINSRFKSIKPIINHSHIASITDIIFTNDKSIQQMKNELKQFHLIKPHFQIVLQKIKEMYNEN